MAGVADLVVRRLREAGVRSLFGVPGGGGNLDLIEAAGRGGLPFFLTSTETAAAIAAIAQAEVTGCPGACLTTLGPGAASVVNGVACAYLERAPIFVFTDNYRSGDVGKFEHQRLPHRSLFERITSQSLSLAPDEAFGSIEQAFISIHEHPYGPVHIDCPADFESAQIPEAILTVRRRDAAIGNDTREQMEQLLERARKPLVIAGLGARRPEDAGAIRRFCERRRVPAMVTYKAKGVVPDDHAWFAGVFTNAAIERPIVDESDLLIGIGLDPVELLPRPWTHMQPVIYCGPPVLSAGAVPFSVTFEADVAAGVAQMEARLETSAWDSGRVRARLDDQRRAISIPSNGFTAQHVVEGAAAQLARECRVTVDAGAHMFPATMLWPVAEPNGMLISNGLSTMGFALPAAIGAALVDRPRPVVALTGDGGLLMCVGELMTAARERLRVIVIVFNDAALSLIEIKQQARKLSPAGVALAPIDWPALAASFGVPAFIAREPRELERAIAEALTREGPSLIDARVDRSNYGDTIRAIRGQL
jgi:acetolactate synthase I/II/III large subunit